MMPIAKRLMEVRNDAMGSGRRPKAARISPSDMRQLEAWVTLQNHNRNGRSSETLSASHLWGMDIIEDSSVKHQIVLTLEEPGQPARKRT